MPGRGVSALITLFVITGLTQGFAENGNQLLIEIEGRDHIAPDYTLRLVGVNPREVTARADHGAFGGFAFRSVEQGEYRVQILDRRGQIAHEEFIHVDGGARTIRIHWPEIPKRELPTGDRVSVRQLQNPPSKESVKMMKQAAKYSESGEYEKAAGLLEKVLQASPEYAEAHTNLAAQYLRMGEYGKALEHSGRALEIAPPNSPTLINRALAEWALGRREDALRDGAHALRLNPEAASAHFIVGSLLAANPETVEQSIAHLEYAAEKLPSARKALEKVRSFR